MHELISVSLVPSTKNLMYIKSIIRFFFVIVSVLIKTDLTLSYVKQESIH